MVKVTVSLTVPFTAVRSKVAIGIALSKSPVFALNSKVTVLSVSAYVGVSIEASTITHLSGAYEDETILYPSLSKGTPLLLPQKL